MKRVLFAPVLFVLAGGTLSAQSGSALSADRVGRIDRLLQEYVDDHRISGAVTLVLRDGRPIYERAVGWSDKEAGRRMTRDTIFRIASQTKAITSVAVLSLMEEGKVGLTDPVSRFIPAFASTTVAVRNGTVVEIVPAKRPITIRDLLTHTAGISYGTQPDVAALYEAKGLGPAAGFGGTPPTRTSRFARRWRRWRRCRLSPNPARRGCTATTPTSSGVWTTVRPGVPLDEFVRTRITGPLGMKDTRFFLSPEQRSRLAAVYASGSDGRMTRAPEGPRGQGAYVDGARRSFAGGAGLLSTAGDYARHSEMIRNGGALDGVRILALVLWR